MAKQAHRWFLFQSTPSAWRVTLFYMERETMTNISIHTLRVEGDLQAEPVICPGGISIHTLRVEGDHSTCSFL